MTSLKQWMPAPGSIRERLVLALALVAALFAWSFYVRPDVLPGRWVGGYDPLHYYIYLPSILIDHDLDFQNQLKEFEGRGWSWSQDAEGRPTNPFSIRPAIFWSPFYLAAHLWLYWRSPSTATGYGPAYESFVYIGAMLYVFLTALLFALLLPLKNRRAALVALAISLTATQFPNFVLPLYLDSHTLATAAVAGMLYFSRRRKRFFLACIFAGIMILVRWQLVVLTPLLFEPLLNYFSAAWIGEGKFLQRLERSMRAVIWKALLAASILVVMFLPQALAWRAIYGSWLLIPQGSGFLQFSNPQLIATLFDANHGWLLWHPVYLGGIAGIFLGMKRDRLFFSLCLVTIAASLYVNSIVSDWNAGWSFGNRRFSELLPVMLIGLEHLLERIFVEARVRASILVAAFGLLLCMANLALLYQWRNGLIPRGHSPGMVALFWGRFEILGRMRAREAAMDAGGQQLLADNRTRFFELLEVARRWNPHDPLLPALDAHADFLRRAGSHLDSNTPEMLNARRRLQADLERALAE